MKLVVLFIFNSFTTQMKKTKKIITKMAASTRPAAIITEKLSNILLLRRNQRNLSPSGAIMPFMLERALVHCKSSIVSVIEELR